MTATLGCFSGTRILEGMGDSPSPALHHAPQTEDSARGAWTGTASNVGKPLPVSCWHLKHIHSMLALFHAFV